MPNQLQFEKSPYLLQHKDNPVNWLPWGQPAFELARNENKPVLLSIGYSTCHWCHVMAHESFEDETVAEIINGGFVPIKVDREERPDVDAVYMAACTMMTGSGGWPLTILMTPEQKPFWTGTYLPKDAFLTLLKQVKKLWQEDQNGLLFLGDKLTAHLQQEEAACPEVPRRQLVKDAVFQYAQSFDSRWGGFGGAPKFPTPHNLIFLMRYARYTNDKNAMQMAEKTLESMYRGGLFDHIGGGFSRYSTDERWLVPHFEKMLYDNALLAFAYAEAFQYTQRPLYRTIVRRTLDYILRELQSAHGGFFCGQDADSEGVEGKYYVFTKAELRDFLGADSAEAFCQRYGVTGHGNFEGKNIPNLLGQQNIDGDPDGMESIREQLYSYRQNRFSLHKDDKILTAWNGLMIAAFAKAGFIMEEPRYLDAARRAVDFIDKNLTTQTGRLLARWRDGESAHTGKLDDYSFYAWGLLELYSSTFSVQYLSGAQRVAELLLEFFLDSEQGGLYPYASDGEQLLTRSKEMYDGAMPSGNSVAALVFSRLARLTGELRWHEASKLQLSYLAWGARSYPAGHSFAMLSLLEELWPSSELVCTSKEVPAELHEFLRQSAHPSLSVLVKTAANQQALSELAPFTAAYPIPVQRAQYYFCKNGACIKPTDNISDLNSLLRQ